MIPNCIPCIEGRELEYLSEAVNTNSIAIGRFIIEIENYVAKYTRSSYAIALSSGTAALHLALLAHNIGKDEEVIVPAITFAATAFAVRYCNAWPLFIDCDPISGAIDLNKLHEYLESNSTEKNGVLINKHTGRKIRAILPVHLYGHPVDIDKLLAIAKEYNLLIIDDAAEALGAEYKSQPIGSSHNTSILSFNGNKLITAGGGGMLLTENSEINKKVRSLANQSKENGIGFVHSDVGYNYRMPNINAAMALAQMEQADKFIEKKRFIMDNYMNFFNEIENLSMLVEEKWAKSTYWMAILKINTKNIKKDIVSITKELLDNGIEARPVWKPLSEQVAFNNCQKIDNYNAMSFYNSSLCLPCSSGITDNEIQEVCEKVKKILLH